MEIRDEFGSPLVPKNALALTTNKIHKVLCRVYGSRPPPKVSWWKTETKLPAMERFGQVHNKCFNTLFDFLELYLF